MEETYRPPIPDTSHLITETDEPVDNVFSEKQMRLLTEPLYVSWKPGRDFWVAANVGMYAALNAKAVVPDAMVSMDTTADVAMESGSKCYFFWEHGKPPEITVEIVSNAKGGELDSKLNTYYHLNVYNYAVFDPAGCLSDEPLQIFEYGATEYRKVTSSYFPKVGLGLKLWEGKWENTQGTWLRWCDSEGELIATGEERAETLSAKLRELGVDPDSL